MASSFGREKMAKQINISKHSYKRFKQRFNLSRKSLVRMINKGLESGVIYDNGYSVTCVYSNFRFILKNVDNGLLLVTVSNLDAKTKWNEDCLKDEFVRGKNIGKMIVRN